MVPINPTTPQFIQDHFRSIVNNLNSIEHDSLDFTFASWIFGPDQNPFSPILSPDFSVTTYQHVASLAFLTATDPQKYATYADQLKDGLKRIAGRAITLPDGQMAPLSNDVVALLGLSIGAENIGGDTKSRISNWLQSFANPANEALPPWKRVFLYSAMSFLGNPVDYHDIQHLLHVDDIKLAFTSKGGNFFGDVNLDQAYQAAAQLPVTQNPETAVLACRTSALYYLSRKIPAISMTKPTVEQIVRILKNIPSGLKRWPWEEKAKTLKGTPQKWNVQNEYHVQSLLYFLLAPIFPDIEHEFYFEPAGQLNSRADLGLPSVNLIIELKFLRPTVTFGKMIEEVASDASLYFKKDSVYKKKYTNMLVFLWDDSARIQEHRSEEHTS